MRPTAKTKAEVAPIETTSRAERSRRRGRRQAAREEPRLQRTAPAEQTQELGERGDRSCGQNQLRGAKAENGASHRQQLTELGWVRDGPVRVLGTGNGAGGVDRRAMLIRHARSADGVEAGWIAGDHILDTRFDLAKNIVNDTLQFALRIDAQKIPGDLLRAYTAVELEGLAAGNPSGVPSGRQRREARSNAKVLVIASRMQLKVAATMPNRPQ